MATHPVDLGTWPRAAQFRFFRTYERPHYALTSRLAVTHLMARKGDGVSAYRGCLYAIGAGLHAVPELLMRFRGDTVVRHDAIDISMTVPTRLHASERLHPRCPGRDGDLRSFVQC